MRGWMLYVRRAFESKGVPNVARQEMLAALDDAVDAGAIPEDLAEVYRTSMPTIRNSDYLDAILTRIAEARDVDLGASDVAAIRQDALDSEGTGQPQGQSFYRPDVQDPASWQGAADSRQAHVRFYSEQALAREDYAVATVLARLGTETERQFTPDERRVVARALVNAAPEGAAGFRRAAMAPWLRGEAMDDAPDPTPPPRRPAAPPPAPPPEPEADTTGTDAAIATATRRSRGRPKGTGKLQQAASAEAQAQADAAENARLVAMGVDAETLRQVEKRFNAVSQTLRAKIMEGDEKASDTLDRITEQLQLARRAHTAYRRDVIEKGSMSD
jgi:hypothetical protein